jgi:hypothetical protein
MDKKRGMEKIQSPMLKSGFQGEMRNKGAESPNRKARKATKNMG